MMRPLSRRLKRWLIVLAALLVVGVVFIWTLPEIVKWQALRQIPAVTGRAVAIEVRPEPELLQQHGMEMLCFVDDDNRAATKWCERHQEALQHHEQLM